MEEDEGELRVLWTLPFGEARRKYTVGLFAVMIAFPFAAHAFWDDGRNTRLLALAWGLSALTLIPLLFKLARCPREARLTLRPGSLDYEGAGRVFSLRREDVERIREGGRSILGEALLVLDTGSRKAPEPAAVAFMPETLLLPRAWRNRLLTHFRIALPGKPEAAWALQVIEAWRAGQLFVL